MTFLELSSEIYGRTLPSLRPLHARGRIPGNARIASCPRFFGLAAYASLSSSSLSSPSNGSLNCTGSLYGASLASGLGGRTRGFLATSRSVCQPLPDDAPHRRFGALLIIEAKRRASVVSEIKFGSVSVQMPLVAVLVDAAHPAL